MAASFCGQGDNYEVGIIWHPEWLKFIIWAILMLMVMVPMACGLKACGQSTNAQLSYVKKVKPKPEKPVLWA